MVDECTRYEREGEELTIVSTSTRLTRSLIDFALCAVKSRWTYADISDRSVVIVNAGSIVVTRLDEMAWRDGNVTC